MCYPGWLEAYEGQAATPRFRTFQVRPKDLPAALRQAEAAEDWARASRQR
jgi:hypothetical protein